MNDHTTMNNHLVECRLRLIIVDDHPVIRRGIRDVLSDWEGAEVVGEASSASEAMRLLGNSLPDLVLLDVTLPDRSGIELLKDIVAAYPHIKVLVLSIHPEEQYALRALRAGAWGYLTKASAPEELLNALARIAAGSRYVTESIAEKLATIGEHTKEDMAPHELLSDREFEVLRLLGAGRTISDIANDLGLSVKTVSTYRSRILEKLGKNSTAELVRYAIDHGLV